MPSTLHAAIAAFNSAVDKWSDQKFTIELREAVDAKIYGPNARTGVYHHVPDGYGEELLAMEHTLAERRNDIIRTGNELVPLLVAQGKDELAIAVRAEADAAKDGNPTHIVKTRRDVKARLGALAATPAGTGGSEGGEANADAILPVMLSASDIAGRIKRNSKSVTSFLTRLAVKYPDCRIEIEAKRRNEPAYLYRSADIWPALEKWMKGGNND